VSLAPWDSLDAVRAWKADPEMRERLARVLQHVDDFRSAELDVVASATHGDTSVSLARENR
jgi:heme-degrading monooxygenase HmoA